MLSKRMVIGCAVILAVLVPLSVLGQGWVQSRRKMEADRASPARAGKMLGTGGNGKVALGSEAPCEVKGLSGLETEDLEGLQERLGLTEDEVEEIERLLEEIEGLKVEIKERVERIHEIVGARIEEKRDECTDIAEKLKPLYEDLKSQMRALREAIEADDAEAQAEIKAEIASIHLEIQAVRDELAEEGCRVPANQVRERFEKALERWEDDVRRIRERIEERIREGPFPWDEISDQDDETASDGQDAIDDLREEIRALHEEIREALRTGDRQTITDLREKLADLMKQVWEIMAEQGFGHWPAGLERN